VRSFTTVDPTNIQFTLVNPADGGDADQYCDGYGATVATAADHTNTALDCDCSGWAVTGS